jgi:hypothetical protein
MIMMEQSDHFEKSVEEFSTKIGCFATSRKNISRRKVFSSWLARAN